MEHDKVNGLFENRWGMMPEDAIDLIKSYFVKYLQHFILIDEYNLKSGQWGVKYEFKVMKITIKCDRGFLDKWVFFDSNKASLTDFEPLIVNAKMGSEKNIRFILDVIKRYVESISADD
jgi:hypothetical protein